MAKSNAQLQAALDALHKSYGKTSIIMLGSRETLDVPTISTGSPKLDKALGVGGIPRGRIVEIYGPESGGKTTLALHIISEAQKTGGAAAFIDAEHALDPVYAQKLGVNIDNLLVCQPDNGEQALEVVDALVGTGALDVIVVDSVAALVPKAELEGDMGDAQMGLQARLMSQAMRKLTARAMKSDTCIIFINQIRDKIGVMFGSPETTTGGKALKFFASIRLDIRKVSTIKDGDTAIGNVVKVKVVKNKVAAPYKIAETTLIFDEGFSKEMDLLELGVELGIIDKSGSWYSMQNERLAQGAEGVRKLLKENKSLATTLEKTIRLKLYPTKGTK